MGVHLWVLLGCEADLLCSFEPPSVVCVQGGAWHGGSDKREEPDMLLDSWNTRVTVTSQTLCLHLCMVKWWLHCISKAGGCAEEDVQYACVCMTS